jgi:dTDP-4-dehydrorhamnose 3,5-epimerase
MRFSECSLPGVFRIDADPHRDARGSFVRLHCEDEFARHGLPGRMVQTSISRSAARGTVRGMHFQWPPAEEHKLVRCLRGRVFDVLIDLRPASRSYGRHMAVDLNADDLGALFVPPGVAHGFQTLEDDCEVIYQMTDIYVADRSGGVRWNDAAFGIAWPLPCTVIHPRDESYADFDAARFAESVARRGTWISAP